MQISTSSISCSYNDEFHNQDWRDWKIEHRAIRGNSAFHRRNLKITFWYLAQTDPTVQKMEGEDFGTVWIDEVKVLETLTSEEHRALAGRALEIFKGV